MVDKKAKAKKAKKKPTPPKLVKPDFGIEYVAEKLDVEEATCRRKLREAKIKKEGRQYDFKTKAAADAIVKKLSTEVKKAA